MILTPTAEKIEPQLTYETKPSESKKRKSPVNFQKDYTQDKLEQKINDSMEKIFPDTLAPSPEVKPKKRIRLKGVSKEIQIPDGCESIKAEVNKLNFLPRDQFTESAYKVFY